MNIWRLSLGKSGNKGKKYPYIIAYLVLTLILVVGFFYIIAIQSNILWLEFIVFIIVLVIAVSCKFIYYYQRIFSYDCIGNLLQSKLNLISNCFGSFLLTNIPNQILSKGKLYWKNHKFELFQILNNFLPKFKSNS